MMKMKLTNIKDRTDYPYLDQNPDFANQLVATLNQIDGFNANELWFAADSSYWTYDCSISPNYEINKDSFVINKDQMQIRSTNRDDLLNVHYYQHLNDLANNYQIKKGWWIYFPQDQVLQIDHCYKKVPYLNIKLTKPIDQYNQNQINAIGKFMIDVYRLIIKDDRLDWEQWKQGFGQNNVNDVGIVFDLNDFANSKILVRWRDENDDNHYENDLLKNVLKADAPLLKFFNNNNLATHFQPYQSRANKFFKRFLDA